MKKNKDTTFTVAGASVRAGFARTELQTQRNVKLREAQALVKNDPRSLVPDTTMQPRIIGRVTENTDFCYRTPDGQTKRLEPKGFEHVLE